MLKIILILTIISLSGFSFAKTSLDQWEDSKKTYKDLIDEGFEIKSYDTVTIEPDGLLIILLFVTVLQKNNEVFECQEYQTLDKKMDTLNISIICKKLVQPYQRGLGI